MTLLESLPDSCNQRGVSTSNTWLMLERDITRNIGAPNMLMKQKIVPQFSYFRCSIAIFLSSWCSKHVLLGQVSHINILRGERNLERKVREIDKKRYLEVKKVGEIIVTIRRTSCNGEN